jgi:hypothetical protein
VTSQGAGEEPQAQAGAPALDLDVLMARLRAEVEARKSRAQGRAAVPAPNRPWRASRLLRLPEAEFVRAAHLAALGREPTPLEADLGLDRLLLGAQRRTALLKELADSAEGRAHGARIQGLGAAALGEHLRESPYLRWLFDLSNAVRTVVIFPRRIVQFVRRVEALEARCADLSLKVEALEETIRKLESPRQRRALSSRKIDHG